MLESNLEALRSENGSLQQRLEKALQELVRAATPSNPAVLRAFKVGCHALASCPRIAHQQITVLGSGRAHRVCAERVRSGLP